MINNRRSILVALASAGALLACAPAALASSQPAKPATAATAASLTTVPAPAATATSKTAPTATAAVSTPSSRRPWSRRPRRRRYRGRRTDGRDAADHADHADHDGDQAHDADRDGDQADHSDDDGDQADHSDDDGDQADQPGDSGDSDETGEQAHDATTTATKPTTPTTTATKPTTPTTTVTKPTTPTTTVSKPTTPTTTGRPATVVRPGAPTKVASINASESDQSRATPGAGARTTNTGAVFVAPQQSCSATSYSQPFARWGDSAAYELAPDGAFTTTGWTLAGGAALVAGGNPDATAATAGARSALIPAGATITSPSICLSTSDPALRFFIQGSGVVQAQIVRNGVVVSSGVVAGGSRWAPSPSVITGSSLLGLTPGGTVEVNVRITGLAGDPRIDDIWIDPGTAADDPPGRRR